LQASKVQGFIDSAKFNDKKEHRLSFNMPLVKSDTSVGTSLFSGN
jgi:hypothetical protein